MYEVLILRINKDTWNTSNYIHPLDVKKNLLNLKEGRTLADFLKELWEPVSMQEITPGVCTQWVFKKLMTI